MSTRRRLGLIETTYKFLHDNAHGYSIISAMARVNGPLEPEIVKQALVLMQKRHPLLRARLSGSDRKYYYMDVEDEPIEFPFKVIERSGDEQWKEIFEQNMVEPFVDGECPWRANFLYGGEGASVDHDLVMGFQHFTSDGISAGSFFGQLLDYCRRIMEKEQLEVTSLPLLPSFEHLMKNKATWPSFLVYAVTNFSLTMARYRKYLDKYERFVPAENRRSKNIFHELDKQKLDRLIDLCRKNDTTLTGLLTAGLMISASKVNSSRDRKGRHGQVTGTAFNVRDLCEPVVDHERLSCFVGSGMTGHIFTDTTSIWDLARSWNEKINRTIARARSPVEFPRKVWMLLYSTNDNWPYKETFNIGVGVTNIGQLEYPTSCGPFLMKKFHFCAAQNGGGLLMLLHAATLGNVLSLNFCYIEPLLSENTAQIIVDGCMSLLESIVAD